VFASDVESFESIDALAWMPEGDYLIGAARLNHSSASTPRIWDVKSGRQHASLVSRSVELVGLCVSEDGKSLVTACKDGNLRFWDLERVRELIEKSRELLYLPQPD
jgi:WD40 repeat protein